MGVYLTGVHLMGVYLICMHLMGLYLINVHLTGVHLMGLYLTVVDLSRSERCGVVPIARRKRPAQRQAIDQECGEQEPQARPARASDRRRAALDV
jgi:hypothetical protein